MRVPNVLTISPALPFLDTFVAAFLGGGVVEGFVPASHPLALAEATIYVPTQRAARALAESFLRQKGAAAILPSILPLGALEATETPSIFADPDLERSGLPLSAAASPLWRRLELTKLVRKWALSIEGALVSVDARGAATIDKSEAFRVATSTVDAFALAGDLAGLIDEMLIEDVDWRALDDLHMASFDDYWRITTNFLAIAFELWPTILEDKGVVDPARRQIALVDAQSRALADGRLAGPVVAIGSTGTNRATARLLAAIARAPDGAIVLPGLDQDLDEAAWAIVSGRFATGQEPSFGHPQAAMARLLPILGVARSDVRAIGAAEAGRTRFVAEALRPADTTDLWRAYRKTQSRDALAAALDGIVLIEAADEREEALCLAIAMREVLEMPGRTAALVTPDRELARRVRAELLRWDVDVLDTGGEPLGARPLGILARLTVAAARALGAREIGALLAHPLATLGRPRDEVARLAAALEVGVLRVVSPGGKTAEAVFAEARASAGERHAHRLQKAITADLWDATAGLWRDLEVALDPLRSLAGEQRLGAWVAAHRRVIQTIAGEADDDETQALDALFEELEQQDDALLRFDAEGYGIFFGRLLAEIALRNTEEPHPRLKIYGLLEARLMQADVMLLGGLDETIWPPQAKSDAFLNRPMRHALGLSPPERRIGQTAHDFVQAMGHADVVLSRARKRAGAPTVASRFLLRLEALGGRDWEACRRRGARTLELARRLDRTQKASVAIARPQPRPPVALRPTRLSVTAIETLRRDPYAIYAARILDLAPLPQIGTEIEAAEIGERVHDVLHRFVASPAAEGLPTARRETLRTMVGEAFAAALTDPLFKTFRWPNIIKMIDVFLSFDAKQRERGAAIQVEKSGSLVLTLADSSPFTLTARADRIDWHADGSALLIDYKTGQPPGNAEVQVGFAPQLTLEAAMFRNGAFGQPHAGTIAATYLKLGGKDGGFVRAVEFKDEAFSNVVDRHFDGLQQLLSSFRSIGTGYMSRPFPKYARQYGDYDHLARVREWSLAADDEAGA